MMKLIKRLFPFIFFALLTIVMTYPCVLYLGSHILGDPGDSLLNSWILAWDAHKILRGEIFNIFDANIFYPHENTLAYSEHLLGLAPFATPIFAISQNPVLTYNLTLLICLMLSGLAMYYLCLHLTSHKTASLFAGIIFGFFPWRFSHLAHLQLQALQWFPLILLWADQLIESGKWRYLMGLYIFSILQMASCGYYALYLVLIIPIFFAMSFYKLIDKRPLSFLQVSLYFALLFITAFPFLWPYFQLKNEVNFSRSINEIKTYSADILSYFCMVLPNKVWGHFQAFRKPEGFLFPGLVSLALGAVGIFTLIRKRKKYTPDPEIPRVLSCLYVLLSIFSIFYLGLTLWIIFCGGIQTSILGLEISATKPARTLMIFLYIMGIRLILKWLFNKSLCHFGGPNMIFKTTSAFYLFLLVFSFLLSLGPEIMLQGQTLAPGPYRILYDFFPGFTGLRVPARFVSMFMLSLSVLSSLGFAYISNTIKNILLRRMVVFFLFCLVVIEIICCPIKMKVTSVGNDIPQEYLWLKEMPGDFAILELPLPQENIHVHLEAKRVYFSIYHRKKLVNGYSGFFPDSYEILRHKLNQQMSPDEFLTTLEGLHVHYLLIHLDEFPEKSARFLAALEKLPDHFKKIKEFQNTVIFECLS